MLDRRQWMRSAASATAVTSLGLGGAFSRAQAQQGHAATVTLPIENGERPLAAYPGKRPLIVLTARPPQLETPFSVFNEGMLTPNDAFFVRYHLGDIPLKIDPETFTLSITGRVETPLKLSLADIKAMPAVELVAVHQCSGNSRGLSQPRVAGGQLANGAMGNARWRGVPLKALLDKAGVQAGAKEVTFRGLDKPVMAETPAFVKALEIDHARDGEVMVAYAMNGEDLPWLNGFPIRLVVPGYFGTYWMKHLSEINVIDSVFDGFWMKTAYRIPDTACACVEPGKAPTATIPINRFNVRSFLTNVLEGSQVAAGTDIPLRGIAFDGGYGIAEVAVSMDGGTSWATAMLGTDLGRYSFREWTATVNLKPGKSTLMVRATNTQGQTQPLAATWNPAGYMRNVIETTTVQAL